MGLAERDYSGRRRRGAYAPSGGLGAARTWSASTWLIAIIVGLFILDAILTPPITVQFTQMAREPGADDVRSGAFLLQFLGPIARHGHFSMTTLRGAQVWRIVTFPLIHADVWPLFLC